MRIEIRPRRHACWTAIQASLGRRVPEALRGPRLPSILSFPALAAFAFARKCKWKVYSGELEPCVEVHENFTSGSQHFDSNCTELRKVWRPMTNQCWRLVVQRKASSNNHSFGDLPSALAEMYALQALQDDKSISAQELAELRFGRQPAQIGGGIDAGQMVHDQPHQPRPASRIETHRSEGDPPGWFQSPLRKLSQRLPELFPDEQTAFGWMRCSRSGGYGHPVLNAGDTHASQHAWSCVWRRPACKLCARACARVQLQLWLD